MDLVSSDTKVWTIAVAVQNDITCHAAIQWAVDLCRTISIPFKLYFVFIVSQNPSSKIPYLDHLEQAYNLEIHEEAKKNMTEILSHLDAVTSGKVGKLSPRPTYLDYICTQRNDQRGYRWIMNSSNWRRTRTWRSSWMNSFPASIPTCWLWERINEIRSKSKLYGYPTHILNRRPSYDDPNTKDLSLDLFLSSVSIRLRVRSWSSSPRALVLHKSSCLVLACSNFRYVSTGVKCDSNYISPDLWNSRSIAGYVELI